MPYSDPNVVSITLQDFDYINRENGGTSILVKRGHYGMLKTKAVEDWATAVGFKLKRVDRPLDEHLRRIPSEPAVALGGLDKMETRKLLGLPRFEYVIDAGLGATDRDCRQFRVNVFNAHFDPKAHFSEVQDKTREEIARKP